MTRRFIVLSLLAALLCVSPFSIAWASFDRLRIVITSSSDWTILRFAGNESIVNADGAPLRRTPEYRWNQNSLAVNQPYANALDEQSVQVQFDIILESDAASLIAIESTKGDFGVVQIDFYQFNTSTPELIERVENANTGGHPNPKPFTVDAALLLEGEFGSEFSRPSIPPLILAFYYPWYYSDSWESPILQDQPLAPYSSDNVSVISHHVHLAKQAGIDGFISSWWGPDGYTEDNLQKLLKVSEDMDFTVSIYFETLTGDPPQARPEDEILSWLRYFLDTYGQNERFLRLDGKPVIFIWAAEAAPLSMWERVLDTLKAEGREAVYSANTLNPSYLQVFDGLHDYGPAFKSDPKADFHKASNSVKTYGWLRNDPQFRIWAATLQPGYDDTTIPGRDGHTIDRADGETYDRTFEASINSDPDWILITSFNEWWEHTHIEPSVNHGNLYLELTAKYADIYKGIKPRPPADFYVPPISEPDGIIYFTWDSPLGQTPDSYNIYRGTNPNLVLLAAGITGLTYSDFPPTNGTYYYAVTAVFGDTESPFSEIFSTISSRNKSRADPGVEIPVDIAIYTGSTSWISKTEANRQAELLIQTVSERVNRIEIVGANVLPDWVLSHTKNGQPDIILTFGDFPDSIYPSGNQQPDNSLAELFLDDGNIFLNTADYIFYGKGRNEGNGLINMMDIFTSMWGDNTAVRVTEDGAKFTPSLQDFVTGRPFHIDDLAGTDWEVEVSFADDGINLADPVIVRNQETGGRIGIIYQTSSQLPRAQVISEIILNWLPTVLPSPPWDVNADGQVDLDDLMLVALHFGETVEESVSPNPDINKDGVVNILDLTLVGSHFSEMIAER